MGSSTTVARRGLVVEGYMCSRMGCLIIGCSKEIVFSPGSCLIRV